MITIQGINLEVTDSLREHVEYGSQKLSKYNNHNGFNLKVNLKVEAKDTFDVVVIVEGKHLTAHASGDNMYNTITQAFDNIENMLSYQKSKHLAERHEKINLTEAEE